MKIRIFRFIFIFCLFASRTSTLFATHVIGGDLTYKYIGNDSFLVTSTFYRDCNGIPISGGLFTVTPSGGTAYNVTSTHTLTKDITPISKSTISRCASSSSSFYYGMQMVVFVGEFKTDGSTCDYTISETECCLSEAITTGAAGYNFYVESNLNVCEVGNHNSPTFDFDPLLIVCTNTCISMFQNTFSNDGDSLVYSLASPLSASGIPISYSSYSASAPLAYSGSSPSDKWNPPNCNGFHFDAQTGEINFSAKKEDLTVICFKVDQWHKNSSGNYKNIGSITRQTCVAVITCPSNHLPTLSGIDSTSSSIITVCQGTNADFKIYGYDPDINDSITMSSDLSIPNATFFVSTNPKKPTGTFLWSPKVNDIRAKPYNFIVTIVDNASPVPAKYQRLYSIYLIGDSFPKVTYSKKYIGCGNYSFNAKIDTSLKTKINWKIDGITGISQSQTFNYHFTKAGMHHIDLQITSVHGCVTHILDSVKSDTLYHPTTSFSVNNGCAGVPIGITNNSKPAASQGLKYFWKFGDGDTSTKTTPSKSYSKTGTYSIWLFTKTDSGCSDSINKSIIINPVPIVAFTYSTTCTGKSTVFTNNSRAIPDRIVNSVWKFGDGNTSLLAAPSYTYGTFGNYTVSLIETTNNGCKDSISQNVIIYPYPASVLSYSSACVNDSTQFNNTGSFSGVFKITLSRWDFGDGSFSSIQNPKHKYTLSGKYLVWLTSKNDGGCADTIKQIVTIIPGPKAVTKTITNNCFGNISQFGDNTGFNAPDSVKQWEWAFGDNSFSSLENTTHTYLKSGVYNFKFKVQTKGGCMDSVSKTITIYPLPNAGFTTNVAGHRSYSFSAMDKTLLIYNWDFGDKTTGTGLTVNHTYGNDGNYNVALNVTNANNCDDTTSQKLTVNTTGISTMFNESELNLLISPNPCREQFNFSYTLKNQRNVKIDIIDINGKVVTSITHGIQLAGLQNYSIKTSDYQMKPGVYTLRIEIDGKAVNRSIVKE